MCTIPLKGRRISTVYEANLFQKQRRLDDAEYESRLTNETNCINNVNRLQITTSIVCILEKR